MRIISVLLCLAFFTMLLSASCNRDHDLINEPDPTVEEPTELELMADSIFLFSKEIYYWQDKIAKVSYNEFSPRNYIKNSDTYENFPDEDSALNLANTLLAKIRTYNIYDQEQQFSFAESYQDPNNSSKATYRETNYGFFVKAGWKSRIVRSHPDSNDPDFDGWYITYVFPDSDAGNKKVRRGMKILKINSFVLKYDQPSIDLLNDLFYYEKIKTADFELLKPDGDTLRVNLAIRTYLPNSILDKKILTTKGGKKVGYLVYKFFDEYLSSTSIIDQAFLYFKSGKIEDIVIDLRYNNGGYTKTQDYLINYLTPKEYNGSKMYSYFYNDNLQNDMFTLVRTRGFKNGDFKTYNNIVNFKPQNSLDFPKIYIIMGGSSASSSELLINNLKGIMGNNVVLIGDDYTFGKPVGFFGIDLFKRITFWTVSFITKNQKDIAVPYDGIAPDYVVYDGVDKVWGDRSEDCLKKALDLVDGITNYSSKSINVGNIRTFANKADHLLNLNVKQKPSKYSRMLFKVQ